MNVKKLSLALVATLLLALVLVACGGTKAPASQSQPTVADDSTLVMATEATFRPYEYMEGTEVVGVDVDIATEIAKELGKELVIEEMPFDAVIAAVSTGKADFGAAGLSVTPEREEKVDFSIEYATSEQVILTTADSGINAEEDLLDKIVGVQMGTVADIALSDEEDYPDITVERYDKYTDAVNDLMSGRLDALVLDSLPAEELKTMGDDLVITEEALFTDVYAICVQKGNTELLDAIDTVLQRLIDEGKIEEFTTTHLS